ncbi:hypothetical protein [Clostridium sp. KNHs216]|uniref:hypothetical protein n=1 Tax=Clostridium sp. KNHs216 TaxID=1550235 RepID=UPI00114F096C|nr:hypothetical protein [Clostridium sp. KNHs216]TQI66266.1 hypothetical protein LY85_0927 [Clostridium sp. KNHs216]
MAVTYVAGKAKRKDFAVFFKTPGETPAYELIGKGIEDASINPNATVDTVNDITGAAETTLSGYEKSMDLDPIYIHGGEKFPEFLDNLEETNAILDDVVGTFLFVKMYKTDGENSYVAWEQTAVVELTGFGGDTKGVNAPCTLHFTGERTMGTFNPTTKTFTAT